MHLPFCQVPPFLQNSIGVLDEGVTVPKETINNRIVYELTDSFLFWGLWPLISICKITIFEDHCWKIFFVIWSKKHREFTQDIQCLLDAMNIKKKKKHHISKIQHPVQGDLNLLKETGSYVNRLDRYSRTMSMQIYKCYKNSEERWRQRQAIQERLVTIPEKRGC